MDRPETKRGAGAAASLFLPDDAVKEILSRVPAKSLCRFKCVSQGWHGLISDLLRRARKDPSWFILDRTVRFAEKAGQGRWSEWKVLDCRSKTEYGCGDYGSSVLEDLLLLARVVDPPGISSLCIQASICAGPPRGEIYGRLVATEKNLAIIWVYFYEFSYYLIYNSDDLSLTMIRDPFTSMPSWGWWTSMAAPPAPVQREGSDYPVLVFLVEPVGSQGLSLPEGVEHLAAAQDLGVWGHLGDSQWKYSVLQYQLRQTQAGAPLNSSSVLRPVCKKAVFKSAVPRYIQIHDAFSWGGKFFWVDLRRGVLSCDLSDLLDADNIDQVSFTFIDLPHGHQLDIHCIANPMCFPLKMYRTMACVGGSLKFLSIEMYFKDECTEVTPPEAENRRVTVWTLEPETMGWKKNSELRMKDLWQHQDFSAQLPESPWGPRWPILGLEDGVFYMTIGDFYGDDESDEEDDTSAGEGLHNICITMRNDKLFSVSSCRLPPTLSGHDEEFRLAHSRLFQGSKGLHSPLVVRKGAAVSGHGGILN